VTVAESCAEPAITLYSDGLLSKWGFSDGDAPDAWLDYCDDHGIDFSPVEWHSVLVKLVRRYLLPVLDQQVEVAEIVTIHNPIRAERVDGADVTDGWYTEPAVHLTPESVTIPMSEVIDAVGR
jgi:hypothetical protein